MAEWQKKAMPNVMALGCFDGLHHGHCTVIHTAFQKAQEKKAELAVMSFFPHPKTVISNGKVHVHTLMPLAEKEDRLRKMGVDTFYIVEFDKEFAALTFEEYNLMGTPSTILVDRKGLVRDIAFGADGGLQSKVDLLLKE